MSLGVKSEKTFLNIKNGKILYRKLSGEELFYDFVEGKLVDITHRLREFKGEQIKYWYIDLEAEGGVTYSLSLHYTSGVAKSIFNALASADTLGTIKIETYQSGEFTKAVVYNNGERLSWKYKELPPIEEVKVGDKIIKDDTRRMFFFAELAKELKRKIVE